MTHLEQAMHHLRMAQPSEIDALPPDAAEQLSLLALAWWMRAAPTRHADPHEICLACFDEKTIVDGNGDEHPCPDCQGVKMDTPQAA